MGRIYLVLYCKYNNVFMCVHALGCMWEYLFLCFAKDVPFVCLLRRTLFCVYVFVFKNPFSENVVDWKADVTIDSRH